MKKLCQTEILHVTRKNISWAVERSGYSREEIEKALDEAEKEGVVCTLTVKPL